MPPIKYLAFQQTSIWPVTNQVFDILQKHIWHVTSHVYGMPTIKRLACNQISIYIWHGISPTTYFTISSTECSCKYHLPSISSLHSFTLILQSYNIWYTIKLQLSSALKPTLIIIINSYQPCNLPCKDCREG